MKNKDTIRKILEDKNTFATVLLTVLVDQYSTEFIEWDPTALALQLKDDFGVELSGMNNDRIQAACSLLTSDMFFEDPGTFISLCNAFSFDQVGGDEFIPADLDNCAWGCIEAKLMLGKDYSSKKFSSDIALYVGALLDQEGIYNPPTMLDFAIFPDSADQTATDRVASDPILYRVFWERQQETKNEIEAIIQSRLSILFTQLKNLPADIDKGYIEEVLVKLAA